MKKRKVYNAPESIKPFVRLPEGSRWLTQKEKDNPKEAAELVKGV